MSDSKKKKSEEKAKLREEIKSLRARLVAQQQQLRAAKLPVLVLIEGWSAAGKGSLIKEIISEIDPRFYQVISPAILPESESRYPFLYPFAKAIPENGKLVFLDSGWMESAVRKVLRREITREEYKCRLRQINEFERQLRGQYAEYPQFKKTYDEFMEKTEEAVSWHVLDGMKKKATVRDALKLLVTKIDKALEQGRYVGEPFEEKFPLIKMPTLKEVDLSPVISDEEYKKELKKLQSRLSELHNMLYDRKIPVILCYEGWDAAGKGGNIRRVAYPLDPRGVDVHPIASPEPHELNRQFLWRFWTRLPRSGHICIFDRTWYGRVMVERLEGFCSEKDWQRAYNEINEFERTLTDWGAVVMKFWIHIDQDTQLARFTDRQNTPEKQWKITDEDWRNREKWPEYEVAVDEMLQKTSTKNAPWYIIESNDKKYARIKTLRLIVKTLEKAVKEHF